MRTLLAVLNRRETAAAVLASAGLLAQRLMPARIEVLHVRPAADPAFMPTEEIMTPARAARFAAATAAESAAFREVFSAWSDGADAIWREETGVPSEVVAQAARQADLLVIGRAAHRQPGDGHAAIGAALFEAHAAVVLVPQTAPTSIGTHVAVAWKASETAERAIVAALPLLRAAARVTVLIDAAAAGEPPPPAALLEALALRDMVPETHQFTTDTRAIGETLLRAAHLVGADLLVMGAFAHRPGVEALMGGATRDILGEGDLPVFLRH